VKIDGLPFTKFFWKFQTDRFIFVSAMLTKSEKTKQMIIEKAAPLFNTKGYAGTTMNDLMKVTGLAKGGLYGNFASKDEIAALAFEYSYNKVKTDLLFKIKQQPTTLGKLNAIINFYRNYAVRPTIEGGCPLMNTAVDADDAYPFLKQRAKQALNDLLNGLQQILENGIAHDELKKTINARKEAEIIFAQIEGGLMMAKVSDDAKLLYSVLDNLKHYIDTHLKK